MPVVEVSLSRLKTKFARNKISEQEILESLPYVGLDIEGEEGDLVRVEYSPNRPDFSSEAGIARSLIGILDIETGLPRYNFRQGQFKLIVEEDQNLRNTRPYIHALSCEIRLNEDLLKRLIAMQEDLHSGIGRKRSKVAIGFHDASKIKPPLRYFATRDASYSFIPLGARDRMILEDVVKITEQGQAYGNLLSRETYPLLVDSKKEVLSMPPVINAELTRVKEGTQHLFVDVTSTDSNTGDLTIAIIAAMLSDEGARVETVEIQRPPQDVVVSPDMSPKAMKFDLELTNSALGLELSYDEAKKYLGKSRLDLWAAGEAKVPRYRGDIIHPIDLAEEVAIGYGIQNLAPRRMPRSSLVGSYNSSLKKIDVMIDAMVGCGFTEVMNLSLVGDLETRLSPSERLEVEEPKSQRLKFIRSDLISSLLSTLSGTTHEEYPQRIFEAAKILRRAHGNEVSETGVIEEQHLAGAIASSDSNYSQIKSLFEAFTSLVFGESKALILRSPDVTNNGGLFASGRMAKLVINSTGQSAKEIGQIGEISPQVLDELGLRVPVSAFELNLEHWL